MSGKRPPALSASRFAGWNCTGRGKAAGAGGMSNGMGRSLSSSTLTGFTIMKRTLLMALAHARVTSCKAQEGSS